MPSKGNDAIVVEGVTLRFRPYVERKPTIRRGSLFRLRRREIKEVTALDDVSFTVPRGEAIGVVGRNGAGKSTLLRCIAGTLRPDEGKVTVRGRVSSLLQLGVGFNPELSGRQNIYLGALAHGLRKAQIDDLYDEIVEYAELEHAIDRPLKTYSSGMFSRLAFSIGIALKPDILMLDEVLSVGDEGFRRKSRRAMTDLLERSGTIVFVSHSLDTVEEFCDSAIWLHDGHVRRRGSSKRVVRLYREWVDKAERLSYRGSG